MKNKNKVTRIKTNKLTRKSWIEDGNKNRLTPQFNTSGIPPREIGDFVYMTATSIGQIIFHKYKNEIICMEHGTEQIIENFYEINENFYAVFVRSRRYATPYVLFYDKKGCFLGTAISKDSKVHWKEKIVVIRDGNIYIIDKEGKREFWEGTIEVKKDGQKIYIDKDGNIVE